MGKLGAGGLEAASLIFTVFAVTESCLSIFVPIYKRPQKGCALQIRLYQQSLQGVKLILERRERQMLDAGYLMLDKGKVSPLIKYPVSSIQHQSINIASP
jgi:hypothetical protein